MSRADTRKPAFRLALGYPDIHLVDGEPGQVILRASQDSPGFARDLRAMAAVSRNAQVTALLPENAIWRGEIPVPERADISAEDSARETAAQALGLAGSSLAIAIAPARSGVVRAAAVPMSILVETRDFLASTGFGHATIAAAADFPPFALHTRHIPTLRTLALTSPRARALAGGILASAAVWFLAVSGPVSEQPVGAEVAPAVAPLVAEATPSDFIAAPPARPADFVPRQFVPESTFAAAPGRPEPLVAPPPVAAPPSIPEKAATAPVTMASRSIANLPAAPARMLTPEPERSVFRLATLEAARDRVAAGLKSAPLVLTPFAPRSTEALPRVAELRPVERPVTDAEVRTVPELVTAASAGAGPVARPRPRPGGAPTPDLSAAITDAVAAVAAEPVRAANPGAATALAAVTRPEPRRIAAVAVQQPKPTFAPQAPTVTRGNVQAAAPAVRAAPAPTPVRQVAVAAPAPAPAPAIPRAAPARAAPQSVGLQRNEISLVGVFGSPSKRRAILRLPNGKMTKVEAGDRVDGARVAAVGSDSVRLSGRSQDILLKLP